MKKEPARVHRRLFPGRTLRLVIAVGLALASPGPALAQDLGAPPVALTDPEPREDAWFGFPLATGDVNGDGHTDILTQSVRTGRIVVFHGPDLASVIQRESPDPNVSFLVALAAGDVNGDGYDDVVTGSIRSSVHVLLGPDLAVAVPLIEPAGGLGISVDSIAVGDLDGDGFDDVVVGSPLSDPDTGAGPLSAAGAVYIFPGPDLVSIRRILDPEPEASAFFGLSVAVGDVNGDGSPDLAVSAGGSEVDPGTGPVERAGEAFVFLGPDLTAAVALRDPTPHRYDWFGDAVAFGDVNGDGYADLAVGGGYSRVETGAGLEPQGAVHVFLGPNLDAVNPLQDPTPDVWGGFGWSMASGDVNADGFDDVVVGSRFKGVESGMGLVERAGEAIVFLGPDLTASLSLHEPSPEYSALFSAGLAAGDVDGDGAADVIAGALRATVETDAGPIPEAGEVFLFHGNHDLDGDGLPDRLDPDPSRADIDGDGIPDGSDPGTIGQAVAALPPEAFGSGGAVGQRQAMDGILDAAEAAVRSGDAGRALRLLEGLRRHVDGCPAAPEPGERAGSGDWITACEAQRRIRELVDVVLGNLEGRGA